MHDYSLQPTSGLKPPLQVLSWIYSERKGCYQLSKIIKKPLQNYFFFSTDRSPEYSTSIKTGPEKNISVLKSCLEKVYNKAILFK